MNIHFGQNFTPSAYIDLSKRQGIMVGETFVNTDELVKLLFLHLGVHVEDTSQADRQAAYHEAFRKVADKRTLTESWSQNSLGVSNACLHWRDALVACGWKAEMAQPSSRLQVLADVEKHFNMPGAADNLMMLLQMLSEHNPLADSTIHVAASSLLALPPMTAEILRRLEAKGTKLVFEEEKAMATEGSNLATVQNLILSNAKGELKEGDKSVEIWNFPTALDAYRYIAAHDEQADLFICDDVKALDNVQRMMGQATSGSTMKNAHPQIAQLFKLGITLFEHPMNIRNLVSWLMMPNHPIPYELRHSLAKVIVKEGGIKNKEYLDAIHNYKEKVILSADSTNEDASRQVSSQDRKRQIEKIDNLLSTYIPKTSAEGVEKAALCNFLLSLGNWCNKMTRIEDFSAIKHAQFAKVGGLCNALSTIVRSEEGDFIPYRKVESWASSLYEANDFGLYEAQEGSRWTVSAGDLVDPADSILWTDCYNYSPASQPTDFLNANELEALTAAGCRFWDNDSFNLTAMHNAMRPALMAKRKLILVTAKESKNETTAKHPLIIRLEETYGEKLDAFVRKPVCDDVETAEVAAVDHKIEGNEVTFSNNNLVAMPGHESYSSLENLIQYPLDYFMEKVLGLNDKASYQLDDINRTKGNVAHAVIEQLFHGSANDISEAYKSQFDEVFDSTVEQKGAILLLKENLIETQMFRQQLKENIEALIDIIRCNNLQVEANEQEVNIQIGLLNDNESDPPVKGFVDMILNTPDGRKVVFDFKWTGSKNKHRKLLEQNASLQLALYEKLVTHDMGSEVVATAYYTMPWHKLYTTSHKIADMKNVEHVTPLNNDDLLKQIINSYRYRREEMLCGTVAYEEGKPLDEKLPYVAQTEEQNLVALSEYGGVHSNNLYSNINCFKNTLN